MKDPRRLREGGDDLVVASLLDAARAYRRPVVSRNQILKVLGLPVAISVGAPAAAIASSLGTKTVLVVSTAMVLAAGGGAVVYRAHLRAQENEQASVVRHHFSAARALRHAEATPSPMERPASPALDGPPASEALPSPIVALPPARPAIVAAAPPRRQTSVRQPRAVAAPLTRSEPGTSPGTDPAPAASTPAKPVAPPPVTFSSPEPTARSVSHLPLPSVAPVTPLPPRRAPLAREIALLDAAERAERQQDHRGALARVEEYSREFPDGALHAEAEVLRISALFGAGDAATARGRAQAFLTGAAPSPLTARVASMLSRASRESETKEQP